MSRRLEWIALGALLLFFTACAPFASAPPAKYPPSSKPPPARTTLPEPESGTISPDPPMGEDAPVVAEPPSPRALAALELTEQGRMMIEKDHTDAAIRVLERAVNLYPRNGQNYFYLAEAWLQKGNLPQAKEFHRLAGIYLADDTAWVSRLRIQELKIKNY